MSKWGRQTMGRQTTAHCLNICKVSLDTGRWTWRHNNIVNFVVNSWDTTKYTIHSDIAGNEAAGGGTVPPEVCVTNLMPDITIWDKAQNKFHMFELTCPLNRNIETSHLERKRKSMHISSHTLLTFPQPLQLLK